MIVVDTNVVAALLLNTEATPAAETLLERDPEWAAPILWRSEFRNVLVGYVRAARLSRADAVALAERAERIMQGREFPTSATSVLSLADQSSCSAYDCEFVALAQELAVPLYTRDKEILRTFPGVATRF